MGSNATQPRRIQSMSRACFAELVNCFTLITRSPEDREYPFPHKSLPFARYPSLRYICACLVAAKRALLKHDDVIFTRDIMIAGVVIALGGVQSMKRIRMKI